MYQSVRRIRRGEKERRGENVLKWSLNVTCSCSFLFDGSLNGIALPKPIHYFTGLEG